MERHRAVIIGAGRIGAGYKWDQDLGYTHAGAYMALKDRVELVGFVEPNQERAEAAAIKWGVPALKRISDFDDFDILSVCTPDHNHAVDLVNILRVIGDKQLVGVWMEKPFSVVGDGPFPLHIQVNYQRRADPLHREIADDRPIAKLVVYGKDDETTRCHFRDLSRFWNVPLDYRPFQGPCAYVLNYTSANPNESLWFDNGGVDSAECFRLMLGNLLDAVEGKAELWSPPYVESK